MIILEKRYHYFLYNNHYPSLNIIFWKYNINVMLNINSTRFLRHNILLTLLNNQKQYESIGEMFFFLESDIFVIIFSYHDAKYNTSRTMV